jgi:alpha-amylase/alpha-mannosidase (GH57 family)
MSRYLCIHGHFYQPPRENPWLEGIEIQDSAFPYHDWNERITAECYAPNAASRILNDEKRIIDIASNYSRISFDFGPTLLSWLEIYAPDIYTAVLDADKKSVEQRSGHGNALAQIYNHLIMPLSNKRDKQTQVVWGIKDFEKRFQRFPEGMWLSETAVDIETLEILAEHGVRFTILAPHQAYRVRKLGTGKWKDVSDARVDPTMAYLCRLPSGRDIAIFFYDGPISQAVAFEKLLASGEAFADRLKTGFSDSRNWPQIMNIATDGETYGHHHRFGDMALAYSLDYIESTGMAILTNYGEYLERFPPTFEVQIIERSSWSCVHGVERWKSDCGCSTGGNPEWNQEWRAPLRDALDWLRDQLSVRYENRIKDYLNDPWSARDEYIDVILDRSRDNIMKYIKKFSKDAIDSGDVVTILRLLEVQRHAMLMYTSCGWFFDDLSGIETIQVMQYAGRALQLYEDISNDTDLEKEFLDKLSGSRSNLEHYRNGAEIYQKYVKPSKVDFKGVAAHFAVSSLFEDYADSANIYCYDVKKEDYQKIQAGEKSMAVGKITVTSNITWRSEELSFAVLHLGGHDLNGGVHAFFGKEDYQAMKDEMISSFEGGNFSDIVRSIDTHFETHNYSLRDLFRDEQRRILNMNIGSVVEEFQTTYRDMYEHNIILMNFLRETCMPVPRAFITAAEFILNSDIQRAFRENDLDIPKVESILNEAKTWNIPLHSVELEFIARQRIERLMTDIRENPFDTFRLITMQKILKLLFSIPLEINLWYVQNIYFKMAKENYHDLLSQIQPGNEGASQWTDAFKELGDLLNFDFSAIVSDARSGLIN